MPGTDHDLVAKEGSEPTYNPGMDRRKRNSCGAVTAWRHAEDGVLLLHDRGITHVQSMSDTVLRIRFSPVGRFAPRRSWSVVRDATDAAPPPSVREDDGHLILHLPCGTLTIGKEDSRAIFHRNDGSPVAADAAPPSWRTVDVSETDIDTRPGDRLPSGPPSLAVTLSKRIPPGEHYFGAGERTGLADRRHRRFSNWNVDISVPGLRPGHGNRYQSHPGFVAAGGAGAWGLFLDSTWYSEIDFGVREASVLEMTTLGGELDGYLLTGPTPAAVVRQLTWLTGRPPLPPLWALGFHQSRWSYPDAEEALRVVERFRRGRLPLDALHLDIDYMDGYRVFTWDPVGFPDPARAVAALDSRGVHTVTIVDPGVKLEEPGHAVLESGRRHDAFVRTADGDPVTGYVWPGKVLFPDFARADVRAWWSGCHQPLTRAGVDGLWTDMNEPSVMDRPFDEPGVRYHPFPLDAPQGDGPAPGCHAELHNLYGAQMAAAARDALCRQRPGRPWVLTRSAFTGTQRHAWVWTGDNRSSWFDLEGSLPEVMSLGLSGLPFAGADIGGFYGDCHGELFARWVELGVFYPFMRVHSAIGTRDQEPWSFGPRVEETARRALQLRYRLLPYLYTLAHRAAATGEPLLRPLFYDFPDQRHLLPVDDEAMVGPSLLIAPALRPGRDHRLLTLPDGTWYDFHTTRVVRARHLAWPCPLGRPPLLVPAGTVLPLGNKRMASGEALSEVTLAVYPGGSGRWLHVDDAGGLDAADTRRAVTRFAVDDDGAVVTVTIGPRRGRFRPSDRRFMVSLQGRESIASVETDGRLCRRWRRRPRRIEVPLQDDGTAHRVQFHRA